MKTVVQINSVKNGSTGTIMNMLAKEGRRAGLQMYTSCDGNRHQRNLPTEHPEYHFYIGGVIENKLHKVLGEIFGFGGCFSQLGTWKFLRTLDKIRPDIIHLHNLHYGFINLSLLFGYIKRNKIKVIWTFHDCWAFTGHCPHFEIVSCEKWKEKCRSCPQHQEYPSSRFDDSSFMYQKKKRLFTGVEDLKIVTPSYWLANLVQQSFLKEYPVVTIHNGLDLETFHYISSDFRKKYHLENKIIILGVAFSWGYAKGLDVFVRLSQELSDAYQIVLVGLGDKNREQIPDNIIGMGLTESKEELAQLYSATDIFINPTRADNFPTTHLEALACGTPVITFRTGGAPESIDSSCGRIVEQDDFDGLLNAIHELTDKKIPREVCRKKAECFLAEKQCQEYLKLYE